MRLPRPFYRLPVRFDAERLRAEVAALPASAWVTHPNDLEGNTSLRLISVQGGENDNVRGPMLPTPHLQSSPYIRQVLASFGVVLEPFAADAARAALGRCRSTRTSTTTGSTGCASTSR